MKIKNIFDENKKNLFDAKKKMYCTWAGLPGRHFCPRRRTGTPGRRPWRTPSPGLCGCARRELFSLNVSHAFQRQQIYFTMYTYIYKCISYIRAKVHIYMYKIITK